MHLFVSCSVNVSTGPPEERTLMTGLHVVADLYCNTCWSPVGWKYVSGASL